MYHIVTSGLTARDNKLIGRAMADYSMLVEGDRVLVAVSGGIDSLVLAQILNNWLAKAPVRYELHVAHIDMNPGSAQPGDVARQVEEQVKTMGLSCHLLPARKPAPTTDDVSAASVRNVCFKCARSRRRQLFNYARQHRYTTVAFGHHRDDIIETFFLNLTCAGNISTMRPRQDLFAGRLGLIRPLAYLGKEDVVAIGERLGLKPVPSLCPLAGQTRRQDIREVLADLYGRIPGSREHIFAALGNVRFEYLLNQTDKS